MLHKQKIKLQQTIIDKLRAEVLRLNQEVKELKATLQQQNAIVEAAEKYREEHTRALLALNDAKDRYNEAVRSVILEKKRYQKEFEECLHGIR